MGQTVFDPSKGKKKQRRGKVLLGVGTARARKIIFTRLNLQATNWPFVFWTILRAKAHHIMRKIIVFNPKHAEVYVFSYDNKTMQSPRVITYLNVGKKSSKFL